MPVCFKQSCLLFVISKRFPHRKWEEEGSECHNVVALSSLFSCIGSYKVESHHRKGKDQNRLHVEKEKKRRKKHYRTVVGT